MDISVRQISYLVSPFAIYSSACKMAYLSSFPSISLVITRVTDGTYLLDISGLHT
jgi:hypothetical protein